MTQKITLLPRVPAGIVTIIGLDAHGNTVTETVTLPQLDDAPLPRDASSDRSLPSQSAREEGAEESRAAHSETAP